MRCRSVSSSVWYRFASTAPTLAVALTAALLIASARPGVARADDKPANAPVVAAGSRVAIVGDSITEQKLYSRYVETYLLATSGVPDVRVFQFGWSGETASGFNARAENDLAAFKPTVVTLCYGMNDGGYQPWREAIGTGYETNMRNVLKKLDDVGVKSIVVGSPGAVDTDFFRPGQMMGSQPAHVAYNDTLAHLRDIDRKLASELKLRFADVHAAMFDAMGKAKAKLGKEYDVCGRDGFHPGPNGQLLMAYAFLKGLGLDGKVAEIAVDLKGKATATPGQAVVESAGGRIVLQSTRWPYCFDGEEKSSGGTRSITPFVPFNDELNRYVLKVSNLDRPRAKVQWGDVAKEFSRDQLAAGVNLAAEFQRTPFDESFAKFSAAVAAKQNFETQMIKSIITQFRTYPPELRADPEVAAALTTITRKLVAKQEQLDADARKLLVPVRHELTITPIE